MLIFVWSVFSLAAPQRGHLNLDWFSSVSDSWGSLTAVMRVDSALDTSTNTSASRQCLSIHSSMSGFMSIPGLAGREGERLAYTYVATRTHTGVLGRVPDRA